MIESMDVAHAAVEAAMSAGADYADARVNRLLSEELSVRNGKVGEALASECFGLGVRVRRGGCFGFAAAPLESGEEPRTAAVLAQRAVAAARQLSLAVVDPALLAGNEGHVAEYATPVEIDPFEVSLSERVAFLREAEASMEGREETVVREASCSLRRE